MKLYCDYCGKSHLVGAACPIITKVIEFVRTVAALPDELEYNELYSNDNELLTALFKCHKASVRAARELDRMFVAEFPGGMK